MPQSSRFQHDVEVVERATLALLVGLVLATFLAFAVGTTIYDVGKWLAVW